MSLGILDLAMDSLVTQVRHFEQCPWHRATCFLTFQLSLHHWILVITTILQSICAVNTASRMQSNSKPNRVLCSEYSHKLLREQAPELPTLKRGKIQVKGKGQMTVFWVGTALISAGREPRQDKGKEVVFDLDDSTIDDQPDEVKCPAPEGAPERPHQMM